MAGHRFMEPGSTGFHDRLLGVRIPSRLFSWQPVSVGLSFIFGEDMAEDEEGTVH